MKKSKKIKERVKELKSIIELKEREIAELWAEIRQIKGDAFDMINNARVQ